MIEFTATTHPGNRYQHNEDAIGWSEKTGLWFVADGIGGHARGDLASATVKKALLAASPDPVRPLSELVLLAHEAVLLEGIEQSLVNMGSTVVIARVRANQLTVAWCGDSRAYLYRAGELIRLTRDHSLLEQLLESGVVAPEEAFGHPRRNVLVQALGINEPRPDPGEISLTLDNNDLLLLCSDGVHDELQDNTIADVMRAMSEPEAVVEELERRVLATDARDNLSAICLKVSALTHDQNRGPLDAAALHAKLLAEQKAQATTQARVVDTAKLPSTPMLADLPDPEPKPPKPELDTVIAPAVSVSAATGAENRPQPISATETTIDKVSASESADSSSTEIWVALAVIAFLVVLVLLFT